MITVATSSGWNAGGSIMTFFFPVGLFVVVATILYMLFSRPHRRVPGHRDLASAHAAGATLAAPRPGPSAPAAASPGQDLPGDGRGDDGSPPETTTEGTGAGE